MNSVGEWTVHLFSESILSITYKLCRNKYNSMYNWLCLTSYFRFHWEIGNRRLFSIISGSSYCWFWVAMETSVTLHSFWIEVFPLHKSLFISNKRSFMLIWPLIFDPVIMGGPKFQEYLRNITITLQLGLKLFAV